MVDTHVHVSWCGYDWQHFQGEHLFVSGRTADSLADMMKHKGISHSALLENLPSVPMQATGAACRAAELTDDGADAVELRADMAPSGGNSSTDTLVRGSLVTGSSSPVLSVRGAVGRQSFASQMR